MDGEILINRYILEEIAGEGSYSIVFRGYDQQDKKKVAIKELKSAGMSPEEADEASRLFFNEINILKNLGHPNIAQVYDFFIFQDRQYMVMEWVEGENLEELFKKEGKISQKKALEIMRQAADAICYLQGVLKRIVYRDFKPSNLLLDKSGHLKIIDFGIARHYSPDKTKDTHILGTPGYAPPEAYEGKQTDFSSDIYSLGATIHHITTGEDPLQFKFNFPDPRTYNPDLTCDFAALLRDCLKPREERIADGVELQRRLRKVKRDGNTKREGKEKPAGERESGKKGEADIPAKKGKGKLISTLTILIMMIIGYSSAYSGANPIESIADSGSPFIYVSGAVLFALLAKVIFSSDYEVPIIPILNSENPLSTENSYKFKSDPEHEALIATILISALLYFILSFTFLAIGAMIGRKLPLLCLVLTMVTISLVIHRAMSESLRNKNPR